MNTLTNSLLKRALSILLVTIMVFSLGLVGITSTSAANVELAPSGSVDHSGGAIYFNDTNSKWGNTYNYIYLCTGHSTATSLILMERISGTNLFFTNSLGEWNGATWVAVMAVDSYWNGGNFGYDHLNANVPRITAAYSDYRFANGSTYHMYASGANDNAQLTIDGSNNWTYTYFNSTHTIQTQIVNEDGTLTNSSIGGGVIGTASYLTNDYKTTAVVDPAIKAGGAAWKATFNVVNTCTVRLQANNATGYRFVGWYDSTTTRANLISESPNTNYVCSGVGKTYVARFESAVDENGLSLSTDSTILFAGVPVTFTATPTNGYSVSGNYTWEVLDADLNTVSDEDDSTTDNQFTFTPSAKGNYTVKAVATDSASSTELKGSTIVTISEFVATARINSNSLPWCEYFKIYPGCNYKDTEYTVAYTFAFGDYNSETGEWEYETDNRYALNTDDAENGDYFRVRWSANSVGVTGRYAVFAQLKDSSGNVLCDAYSSGLDYTVLAYTPQVSLSTSISGTQADVGDEVTLTANISNVIVGYEDHPNSYTFTFYDGENVLVDKDGNQAIVTTADTTASCSIRIQSGYETAAYTVEVEATVYDWEGYSNTTEGLSTPVYISIDDPSLIVYNDVVLYFKAPVAWAYKPNFTINGVARECTKAEVMLVEHSSQTAAYYWYSVELGTLTGGAITEINIKGNRDHFYNCDYTLQLMNDAFVTNGHYSVYLAIDNLNSTDGPIVNVSGMGPRKDSCENANNMILTDEEAAGLVESGYSFSTASIGDATTDGKVNVRDATYVQKSLANIVELGTLSEIVSDVNDDGKVTIKDATAIQKQIAGL